MPVPLVDLPDEINMRNISEVTLKWKKPQDNGAVITKYTVYKRTVNEGYPEMPWEQIHDTDSECYTHVLRLERANTYEFKVTATNRCGEGPRGREITKRVTVLGKIIKLKVAGDTAMNIFIRQNIGRGVTL